MALFLKEYSSRINYRDGSQMATLRTHRLESDEESGCDLLVCYHCGEVCGIETDTEVANADGRVFCCSGCRAVYLLLEQNGLCSYYSLEQNPGVSFKTTTSQKRFTYLDDPLVRSGVIDFSDGSIAHATFSIPSIHCASCVYLIEHLYKLNSAIIRSTVDFLEKRVDVLFRESEIKLSEVASLLARVGYEPELNLGSASTRTEIDDRKRQVLNATTKKLYMKIGVAGFAFGNVMMFSLPDYFDFAGNLSQTFKFLFRILSIAFSIPVLFYSASDYFTTSWQWLRRGTLSLETPIAIGALSLFGWSIFEIVSGSGSGYLDSFCGLIFFLLTAKLYQSKTIAALSFDRDYESYFPLAITCRRAGEELTIPVARLQIGDTLVLRNGELLVADSILMSDHATIDYSFLTGENEPKAVARGTTVYAGARIVGGVADFGVVREISQSKLTQLWNTDVFKKEKPSFLVSLSNSFGGWFTVSVLASAGFTFFLWYPNLELAIRASVAVLIVACPCALTLATPFTLGAGMNILARAKFYVKNIGVIAELSKVTAIVFDKTGTLTKPGSSEVFFSGERQLTSTELKVIEAVSDHSTHPLSRAVSDHCRVLLKETNGSESKSVDDGFGDYFAVVDSIQEVHGKGLRAFLDGREALLGSAEFLRESGIQVGTAREAMVGTKVFAGIDGKLLGCFVFSQSFRDGIKTMLKTLGERSNLWLLSGDSSASIHEWTSFISAQSIRFNQSPEEKRNFIAELQTDKTRVAMVGDGLNDAGAFLQANVGIAVTETCSSFTPASDVIVGARELRRLPEFLSFAKYAVKVLIWAFMLSLVYNGIGLYFAMSGQLRPVVAALFMPLSSWSVVLFAWGLMTFAEKKLKAGTTTESADVMESRTINRPDTYQRN